MGAGNKVAELIAAFFHVYSKVGVAIVVVFDGVRRAGLALNGGGVGALDAILAVIGAGGVFYDTGVPHMGNSKVAYGTQSLCGDIVEFTATILFYCATGNAVCIAVAEKSWQ